MTRSLFSDAFLIVEGRDDRLFMERFVASDTCQIRVAYGKQNVRSVVAILDDDRFDGALGMIDADFDRVTGIPIGSRNLVMPECHDLVTMLVRSSALDGVLREFGSEFKISRLGKAVLEALIEVTLPIGYLRLHSHSEGLNLTFRGLNYTRWIDRNSFQADTGRLIQTVKNISERHDLPSDALAKAVTDLQDANYDAYEICVGTDLVEALSIGLRHALGGRNARDVRGELLRANLRLAYSDDEFRASTLRRDVEGWQHQSPGFQVLRAEVSGG